MLEKVPDHPIIHNLEMSGYPDGKAHDGVECPVCHQEAEKIYLDFENDVVGCDACLLEMNAWAWAEENL